MTPTLYSASEETAGDDSRRQREQSTAKRHLFIVKEKARESRSLCGRSRAGVPTRVEARNRHGTQLWLPRSMVSANEES